MKRAKTAFSGKRPTGISGVRSCELNYVPRVKTNPHEPTTSGSGDEEIEGDASAYLAAMVESSNDAVVGVTLGGVITSWNGAARQIFGYDAAEMVGRPLTTLIPADRAGEEENMLSRVQRGERVVLDETVRLRKDGSRVHVAVTVSPIKSRAGQLVGALKIAHDVTAERRTNEVLVQLRLAIDAAPNGMVMINHEGGKSVV